MDIDPSDILSTNVYIPIPQSKNVHPDVNEEFRTYYELQNKNELPIPGELKIPEELQNSKVNCSITPRYTKEIKTLVSIDSRDRIKTVNPKPNNFSIFLGKTFTNVSRIELVSLEFPNTDAVINNQNNKIYWRNQEDIDLDITVATQNVTQNATQYPVYSVSLRTGSYTLSTLQNEITNKLNAVRRKQGVSNGHLVSGDFHFFVVSLDVDTDIVTFTSLVLNQLGNNPLSTSIGSGIITVRAASHGYSTNDLVYILGAKSIAGISTTILTGFHQITVINADTFTFEVIVKAGDTTSGGGNICKSGKKAPFQLLWGQEQASVAQNIGFPTENSSQLIHTNITLLENISMMTIKTELPHNFPRSYDVIGQPIEIGTLSNAAFITSKSYQIIDIVDANSILVLVQLNDPGTGVVPGTDFLLKFKSVFLAVAQCTLATVPSILVTTQTAHNYLFTDIGNSIILSGTSDPTILDDPDYDGTYTLTAVPSPQTFIVSGVIGTLNTHASGTYGYVPRQNPLSTWAPTITKIDIQYLNLQMIRIGTNVPHQLVPGDAVKINNVKSTPVLFQTYTVLSVLDSTHFTIAVSLFSIDPSTIENGSAFVSTGLMTVSYPQHSFNRITNIAALEGGTIPLSLSGGAVVIQTQIDHRLSSNSIVRLSGTNTDPSIDGGYVVTVLGPDTFQINLNEPTKIPAIVSGSLGMSEDFFIYNSEDIGGISKTLINSSLFTVRTIIDSNHFTFMNNNAFASATEIGGGSNVYISSLKDGFSGIQTNTKMGVLNRSINLQGENYCFLTCPQLGTMINTGHVENVFARISLDQPPGYVCFKYLSNPKQFERGLLDKLSELEFSVVNYDNSLYEFSDLDFSYTLEITEVIDVSSAFNVSSKRGTSNFI